MNHDGQAICHLGLSTQGAHTLAEGGSYVFASLPLTGTAFVDILTNIGEHLGAPLT